MRAIESWGRLSRPLHDTVVLTSPSYAATDVARADLPGLAYGMGRSYGDVCLNSGGRLWLTQELNKFISFDVESGLLRCEAGVLLRDIQRMAYQRGWCLPVSPGTQMATLGGAIANDVHGKNHHCLGSFGVHVKALTLARTNGDMLECTPSSHAGLFAATLGGLGLTGVIAEATVQLARAQSPWLEAETMPFYTLDEFFALSDQSEAEWEHTVAWIDCLKGEKLRGIFMRANSVALDKPAPAETRTRNFPFTPPLSLVNRLTLAPFNQLYFMAQKWNAGRSVVHYEPFLYPLDHLHHWNRIYGPKGFYQYQCVVPQAVRQTAVSALLKAIADAGEGSFLAVLKSFGAIASPGLLSFPLQGATLALDFPNRGVKTLVLFERLDAIVAEAGGRLYAAKDARMPRELFERGYSKLNEFLPYRDSGISSDLSRRLMGF